MNTKRFGILVFILSIYISSHGQTALGHIYLSYNLSKSSFKTHSIVIRLSPSFDKTIAIVKILEEGKEERNTNIPIENYNKIWNALLNLNSAEIAKRNIYCGADASVKITFGISSDVTYLINCLSDSNSPEISHVVNLILDVGK